jgi:hypothetical protein
MARVSDGSGDLTPHPHPSTPHPVRVRVKPAPHEPRVVAKTGGWAKPARCLRVPDTPLAETSSARLDPGPPTLVPS